MGPYLWVQMGRKKKTPKFYPELLITNAGSEGKSIARVDGKVIMVDYAVPGDVADVLTTFHKHKFETGHIQRLVQASPDRVDTFCGHFGTCGGCKWQQMSYEAQLRYKQQQVLDAFQRIGKFPFPDLLPIAGSAQTRYYRNKLEYSFTDRKWLSSLEDKETMAEEDHAGLGYHIPGRFDKIFDVDTCYLMDDLHNQIRNEVRDYAKARQLSFFNAYSQEGLLRTMMLRNNSRGEWMVLISFTKDDQETIQPLMNHIQQKFPAITSLLYVINSKRNDTIFDLDVRVHSGNAFLEEHLEESKFRIGPKSFFQTNTLQTLTLYSIAREMAGLSGNEIVYDLYTGVGTIALFMAKKAAKVIGIEYVPQAIEDAKANASLNEAGHTHFYAGDMKDMLTDDLFALHGKPDVVITDPPRAGMHEDVCRKLMELRVPRIVYVSCNPATQARDIALMQELYEVKKVQPVDMFPHTHHVENIALLELK